MQQTTNYALKKPESTDYADPAPLNANMDAIDAELKLDQTHREDATVHIGTAAKATPVDADSVALVDSVDGSKVKRLSFANLKTALGFLFAPLAHKARHASGGADALSPSDIGAVPTTRLVNGKALSADVSLGAGDVGAYTKAEVASTTTKALFGKAADALPDEVFAAIKTLLNDKPAVVSGNYTGSGLFGSGNKNSLVFPFAIKYLAVFAEMALASSTVTAGYGLQYVDNMGSSGLLPTTWYEANAANYFPGIDKINNFTISGGTIQWWNTTNAARQLNANGIKYYYVAFGTY